MSLLWEHLPYGWVIFAAIGVLQAVTCLHVLFTKRAQPSEALFWLLVVLLLPLLGVMLYLCFGIVRMKHAQKRVRRLQCRMRQDPERWFGPVVALMQQGLGRFKPGPEVLEKEHNQLLDRLFPGNDLLTGNCLEILRDGVTAYPRMLADIRRAQHCIRMESYILMSDRVGMAFMSALEQKAREGVDVKVIFDSLGSLRSYFSHYFRRLIFRRQKNFMFRSFSPFNLIAPWRFQLRNHRKLLVVDGKIAYSGGINISDENERLTHVPPTRLIHDLHCRIEGPAVAQFAKTFMLDWGYTIGRDNFESFCDGDFPEPERCGDVHVRVLSSGPGDNYEGTKQLFFAAAMAAKKSLWIMTPYFVPGPEYANMLALTAARGVDVRIIMPDQNDHFFMTWASRNYHRPLLEAGVRIFCKQGIFSHVKALLVDREWGFMGSSNCDNRSFRLNFELDFCFESCSFINQLYDQFEEELSQSREITIEDENRKSYLRQLGENIVALFTPIL